MDAVQAKVSTGFNSLINQIKSLDWQISFTTTQVNQYNGRLANLVGTTGRILKKGMNKASDIFKDTITSFGTQGSGDERGIFSANNTVLLGNGENRDFFRQNSALAVVVVSDEDERSTGGRNLTHNQNGSSGPIENDDLPTTLVANVKTIFGREKKFSGYGIIVPTGNTACYNEAIQSFYGTFYESLASSTGGIVGSLCDTDYSATLSAIGQNIQTLINSVTLNHVPLAGSIRVTLSPAQPGITFVAQGDKIVFSAPPSPGSRITVAYMWQP